MGRIIAVAAVVPLTLALLASIGSNSTLGTVALFAFVLAVLVTAMVIHSHPAVPAGTPVQIQVPAQSSAPAPVRKSGRVKFDLNPPMPKPVADEDMPIERLTARREASKAAQVEADKIKAETRAQVEAERPELTEDRIEQLLTRHYEDVLGTAEGRAMWRKLIAEAEAID